MSLPARLLGANPSIQVSTLLSGSLSTPSAKQAFIPPVYYQIGSFTGDGTTTSVTYNNLPTNYKNIEIRGQFSATANAYIFLQLNGVTSGSYYYDAARTDGSANQTMNTQTSDVAAYVSQQLNGQNTTFRDTFTITIPDYNNTLSRYRTALGMSASAAGGTNSRRQFTHWGINSTSAVSSITIYNTFAFDTKTKWTVWAY